MKTSRSVLAITLGTLISIGMPLAQAAPGPDNQPQGGPQQHNQGNQGNQGNAHGESNGHSQNGQRGNQQSGARPPQDFGPVRDSIREHRTDFGRGTPLPPGVQVAKGHPLPRGYGHRLDRAALSRLPHYEGYEWRRLGTDVVLIAVGTGIVYEILNGVLQ